MNVPFYIAKRHLFAKKKQNAVNIITRISVFVVAVVTAAMVLILSAFNGIESLVNSFYTSIEPELTIEPINGKTLSISWVDSLANQFPNYQFYPAFKEDAIARFDGNQSVVSLYAVTGQYLANKQFSNLLRDGVFNPSEFTTAFLGLGIKYQLQIPAAEMAYQPISLLVPRKGKKISKQREQALTTIPMNVGGVFSINAEFDNKYIFTNYHNLTAKTGNKNLVTQIDVLCNEDAIDVKEKLVAYLPNDISVTTQAEKNKLIFETSKSEKWFTFAILIFICCIAAFNIIASVAMLIIDKRNDLQTLKSIGLSSQQIVQVFILEGMLINVLGIALGLGFGLSICWLQQTIGLVPLAGGTVEYYPVLIKIQDLILVSISIFIIGVSFTYIPVKFFQKKI